MSESVPVWRQNVDLESVQLALLELEPLLRAFADRGAVFVVKVDGQRADGPRPRILTSVLSGTDDLAVRFDDADLLSSVTKAVEAFDEHLGA